MTDQWSADPTPPKTAGVWSSDPTPPQDTSGTWLGDPTAKPKTTLGALGGVSDLTSAVANQVLGHVLDAFGVGAQAFNEAEFGSGPLGLPESVKARVRQTYEGKPEGPLTEIDKAFYEAVVFPAAAGLDFHLRAPAALYTAAQQTLMAMGVHRDFVSIPDAFMGSPFEFHPAPPRESAIPSEIKPIGDQPPAIPRSAMAATGEPLVDSILRSSVTTNAIDHPLVDRSHTVPYTAGGSTPLADPTVYIDHRFPREIEAPRISDPSQTVTFDPAEPFVIHENVEQHTMEALIKGGMDEKSAYRVAHYEFAEKAEGAWYRANDIDQDAAEKIYEPILDRIQNAPDDNPPENLYEKPYPHDNDHFAKGPDAIDTRPTPEEIEQARKILGGDDSAPRVTGGIADRINLAIAKDLGLIGPDKPSIDLGKPEDAARAAIQPMTAEHGSPYSYDVITDAVGRVLKPGERVEGDTYGVRVHGVRPENLENINDLDPNDVEITHKNGDPVEQPRTVAAQAQKGESISEPASPEKTAWRRRYERSISKLTTSDDVKAIINDAVPPDEYAKARAGTIPLMHVEPLADAFGLSPEEVVKGLGALSEKLENEQKVRRAYQLMMDLGNKVRDAAQAVRDKGGTNDFDELKALEIAKMQHSIAFDSILERVVGLRAEWGRTGNVIQEFMESVKNEKQLNEFMTTKKGEDAPTADDLRDLANKVANSNDPAAPARILREARKYTTADKLYYPWVNGLISGLITHTKYVGVNDTFMAYEKLVINPIASAIGKVASLTDRDIERLYVSEAMATTVGLYKGFGNAMISAAKAFRDNMPTPLPGEEAVQAWRRAAEKEDPSGKYAASVGRAVEAAIKAKKTNTEGGAVNVYTGGRGNPYSSKIGHAIGEVIGVPARSASFIHTLTRHMAFYMAREEQAYRRAMTEGAKPWTQDFWQREAAALASPTEKEMDKAVSSADYFNFTSPLGEVGERVSKTILQTPGGRWIFPFRLIPTNLFKAANSLLPTSAAGVFFKGSEIGARLRGEMGPIEQHKQLARLVVASGLGAWTAQGVLSDTIADSGPPDPEDRKVWAHTHPIPKSIRLGDYWYSLNRLGPIGDAIAAMADMVAAGRHFSEGEYANGIAKAVQSLSSWVEDSVGMTTLADVIEIGKNYKENAWKIPSIFGTAAPFSSAFRQTAASLDRYARETRNIIDGFRSHIPGNAWGWGRESLPIRIDYRGRAIANPMYYKSGGAGIIGSAPVTTDPIDIELQRLNIGPADLAQNIKGQKLNSQLYYEYQTLAGVRTNMALQSLMSNEDWYKMPDFIRKEWIEGTIRTARYGSGQGRARIAGAEDAMLARHPELFQQAIQDKVDQLTGAKPVK